MWVRIVALLVGLTITIPLERWAGFQWYYALALGALGYLLVRYVAWGLAQRREMKAMIDAAATREISN